MQRLRTALFLLVVAPAWSASSDASSPRTWQQVEHTKGITVWRLEVPGVQMPGFRSEVVIDAPMLAILEVLREVEHHAEWMKNCAEAIKLKQPDSDHQINYNRTDAPWPVWDRDVILDVQITYASEGVTLAFKNTDATLYALPDHVVRMPRLEGSYVLTKLGATQTRVRYTVEVDIGGSVPMWLAKRVAREMPYETLDRLRARVTKSPSQERQVDVEDPYRE